MQGNGDILNNLLTLKLVSSLFIIIFVVIISIMLLLLLCRQPYDAYIIESSLV